MRYLLLKDFKRSYVLLLANFLLVLGSCKKEVIETAVDAFSQINTEVKYSQGIYNVQFTLQEYPYKEVGIRLALSKTMIHQNVNVTQEIANQASLNRYAVFLNNLTANKTYFYQIYVKDSASDKEVYSDIFSFTTNP